MERKPFEIVAECEMAAFPTAADTERINTQVQKARGARPEVVRATVAPPPIYRDRRYVLQSRFLVWADGSAGAVRTVEGLLEDAGVPCGSVTPSGRALTTAEVPAFRAAPRPPQARASQKKPGTASRAKAKPAARTKRVARRVGRGVSRVARVAAPLAKTRAARRRRRA